MLTAGMGDKRNRAWTVLEIWESQEATVSPFLHLESFRDWMEERPNILPRRRSSFHCVADTVAVLTKSYH